MLQEPLITVLIAAVAFALTPLAMEQLPSWLGAVLGFVVGMLGKQALG